MFDKAKYVTSGVDSKIPALLQHFMWNAIDTMNITEKDYLQIFKLSSNSASAQINQQIIHSQEQPPYNKKYMLIGKSVPIDAKIYVIDDYTHSTMLLADEY